MVIEDIATATVDDAVSAMRTGESLALPLGTLRVANSGDQDPKMPLTQTPQSGGYNRASFSLVRSQGDSQWVRWMFWLPGVVALSGVTWWQISWGRA